MGVPTLGDQVRAGDTQQSPGWRPGGRSLGGKDWEGFLKEVFGVVRLE